MQPEKKQLGPRGGGGAGAARARSEGWEAAGRLGKEREGWGSCLPVGRKGWGGRGVCGRVGCEARIAAGSCGRAGVHLKKWGREGWGGRGVTGSPVQNKNNYKWDKYRMVQIAVTGEWKRLNRRVTHDIKFTCWCIYILFLMFKLWVLDWPT